MTGKKRELGVGCVDLALSERPGRKGWMEAANKRSVRSVTCLRGPAHRPTGNGSRASGTQGDRLRSWAPSQFSSVAEVLEMSALGLPRGPEGGLRSLGRTGSFQDTGLNQIQNQR